MAAPSGRRIAERGLAGALIVVAAVLWRETGAYPLESRIVPRALLAALAALSLAVLIRDLLRGPPAEPAPFFTNGPRFAIAALALALYIALMPVLGYFTATALLMLGLPAALGFRRPVLSVALVAGFTVAVYAIFVVLFERPLPPEFFLG